MTKRLRDMPILQPWPNDSIRRQRKLRAGKRPNIRAAAQPAAYIAFDYEPPTIDDLARLQIGGGGETVDRAYWTPKMWAKHKARYRWYKPWTW